MAQDKVKITAVSGNVEIKLNGQNNWNRVLRPRTLNLGDVLRRQQGSTITIDCGNQTSGFLPANGQQKGLDDICPGLRPPMNLDISAIPDIISPRSSRILTNQPLLRWYAPTNANSFKVSIIGEELNWTTEVSREQVCQGDIAELVYPGKPPLQPGVSYKLIIETDIGKSSEEISVPELGFKLIDQQTAIKVQKNIQEIEQQNLPARDKALKLADIYSENLLFPEAIATLTALVPKEKNPTVLRQLGDLYRWIELPLKAQKQYQEAVTTAEAVQNQSELAAAQEGLGKVSLTLHKKEEAQRWLEAAKATYAELGNTDRVSYLKQRLNEVAE
ncbi:tetratricopeptide repeat protein [Nostoc sp. UHCC 0302]|uniref:tetratricopeptide repeat protein n=1 Tax=Nostoc sp. UHCC 0302 TaxID=3134896 RepID=UPI00311CC194